MPADVGTISTVQFQCNHCPIRKKRSSGRRTGQKRTSKRSNVSGLVTGVRLTIDDIVVKAGRHFAQQCRLTERRLAVPPPSPPQSRRANSGHTRSRDDARQRSSRLGSEARPLDAAPVYDSFGDYVAHGLRAPAFEDVRPMSVTIGVSEYRRRAALSDRSLRGSASRRPGRFGHDRFGRV